MSYTMAFTLASLAAYLLGSINSSIIVSTVFHKVDIRQYGSGNAGSTNAFRVMGKKWGTIVALGDIAKGIAAVWIGSALMDPFGESALGKLIGGVFVVIGHIFPVFFAFRGGKGIMTTGAILAFVDWRAILILIPIFAAVVLPTGYVSLGSLVCAVAFPIIMALLHDREIPFIVMSIILSVLILIMHRQNIVRLLKGKEGKFTFEGKSILEKMRERRKSDEK